MIKNILHIPAITEDDAIFDGSAIITPITGTGLRGNGKLCHKIMIYAVDLFYEDKVVLLKSTEKLMDELIKERYITGAPDYYYEREIKIWRSNMQVGG